MKRKGLSPMRACSARFAGFSPVAAFARFVGLARFPSRRARCLPLLAAALLASACAGPRPPAGAAGGELAAAESAGWGWAVAVPQEAPGIEGAHPSLRPIAGTFDCDLKRRVQIRAVPGTDRQVVVHWSGNEYTLDVVRTPSGALRYQSEASGLTWIIIPAKSMLLDTRSGKQLANDCRPAA